ncbi:MAG: hypothetical protein DHS20C01_24290 [marine bacterium B5-7]|nr:MAG: hypothetical protein DHS20C01_24290 [marine bacterium B5-7]
MSTRFISITRKTLLATSLIIPLTGTALAGNYGMSNHDHRSISGCNGQMNTNQQGSTQHIEGRIAFLKAELGISDAQQDQWQTVENILREQMAHRAQKRPMMKSQRQHDTDMTAPEQLAVRADMMQARLANLQKMQSAISDLYAVLNNEQKEVADELLARQGRGLRHLM